mgnify:CR=1 FL=1
MVLASFLHDQTTIQIIIFYWNSCLFYRPCHLKNECPLIYQHLKNQTVSFIEVTETRYDDVIASLCEVI